MRFVKLALVFLLILFSVAHSAFAATLNTSPDLATYVNELQPNRPQFPGPALRVGHDVTDDNPRGYDLFTLIKFSVASIPPKSKINTAKLTLWQGQIAGVPDEELRVRRVTQNWNENVTYNSRPTVAGDYSRLWVEGSHGFKNFDITSLVQEWVDGTRTNYGVAITTNYISDDYVKTFASTSYEVVANRPKISINYTSPQSAASNVVASSGNFGLGSPIVKITPITQITPNIQGSAGSANANLAVSNVKVSSTGINTVTLVWSTNRNANSFVYYGDTVGGVNRFDKQIGQNDSVSSHSVTIGGLNPGTKYSFKVKSADANSSVFGPIAFFETLKEESGDDSLQTASADEPPAQEDQLTGDVGDGGSNPVSSVKSGIENKVAEYVIDQSNPTSSQASEAAQGNQGTNITSQNPIVMVAGAYGTNRVAGIVMVILGAISMIGAYIVFVTGKHIHKHVRKSIRKGRR